MATDIACIDTLTASPLIKELESIARTASVFISMPYVRGVTPKVLLERGNCEQLDSEAGLERWSGVFRPDEIGLPAFDHGVLYGDAVFEGVLVLNRQVCLWREHLNRLYASAEHLKMQVPYTPNQLSQHIIEAAKSHDGNGEATYMRLVVSRGIGDLGINPARCIGSTVYCIVAKLQMYPKSFYEQGLHLSIAREVRRAGTDFIDPRIKSCNYLNNVLALLETSKQGSQETLMLSQKGFAAEATADNIFLVVRHDGWESDLSRITLSTPAPDACLNGITRQLVLDQGRALGFQVEESGTITTSDFFGNGREVFLTGTAAGLVPVVRVDNRLIGDGIPGPITRQLRCKLDAALLDPATGLSLDSSCEEIEKYLASAPKLRPTQITDDFVRKMFQIIDSRDWKNLQQLFCQDIAYERPGYEPLIGLERVEKFYREERVIASGTHFLEGTIVNPSEGACWGRFIGIHKNGSSIDERFADAYTFENGKVKTRRSYFFRPAV
jgi:branched-chain amino acid aminotransferase